MGSTTLPTIELTYRSVDHDPTNGSRQYSEPKRLVIHDAEVKDVAGYETLEGVDGDGRDICVKPSGRMRAREKDAGAFTEFVGIAFNVREVEDTCKMCPRPTGEQNRDDYRSARFCSTRCEVKHDHIRADARDAARAEAER